MPKYTTDEIRQYVRNMNKIVFDELLLEQVVNRVTEYLQREELFDELYGTSEQQGLDRITIHLYGFSEMLLEYNADAMQV